MKAVLRYITAKTGFKLYTFCQPALHADMGSEKFHSPNFNGVIK